MKKLLLGSAAIAMGMAFAAPAAQAQGVTLDVSGHHKGYLSWTGTDENIDQDGLDDSDGTALAVGDEPDDDVRDIDWLRETEIHFSGEATLDNGLTVGAHMETDIDNSDRDGNAENFTTEEAYVYFSGAWGRVNFGKEDGAAYLLQVAAPSADSNIDGLRQYIQPINYTAGSPTTNINNGGGALTGTIANGQFGFNTDFTRSATSAAQDFFDVDGDGTGTSTGDLYITTQDEFEGDADGTTDLIVHPLQGNSLVDLIGDFARYDYDHAQTGYDNKITYMTPVFNGFQMGASYTPDVDEMSRGVDGNGQDDVAGGIYGDAWEISARYEGQWDEVGIALGGGYSRVNLEDDTLSDAGIGVVAFVSSDGVDGLSAGDESFTFEDRDAWNIGLDLDWMAFGLGAAYTEQEAGLGGALEADTWTVGADYTTGPFKFGLNYYTEDRDFFDVAEIETERYSAGVVYTYGPGMTFRGSVNYTDVEMPTFGDQSTAAQAATNRDQDATSVLLGTQINF